MRRGPVFVQGTRRRPSRHLSGPLGRRRLLICWVATRNLLFSGRKTTTPDNEVCVCQQDLDHLLDLALSVLHQLQPNPGLQRTRKIASTHWALVRCDPSPIRVLKSKKPPFKHPSLLLCGGTGGNFNFPPNKTWWTPSHPSHRAKQASPAGQQHHKPS